MHEEVRKQGFSTQRPPSHRPRGRAGDLEGVGEANPVSSASLLNDKLATWHFLEEKRDGHQSTGCVQLPSIASNA